MFDLKFILCLILCLILNDIHPMLQILYKDENLSAQSLFLKCRGVQKLLLYIVIRITVQLHQLPNDNCITIFILSIYTSNFVIAVL